jgi:hypothetical protein
VPAAGLQDAEHLRQRLSLARVRLDAGAALTLGDVGLLLSVDPKTAARWVAEGKVGSIMTPGGHGRVPAEVVRAILDGDGAVAAGNPAAWGARMLRCVLELGDGDLVMALRLLGAQGRDRVAWALAGIGAGTGPDGVITGEGT